MLKKLTSLLVLMMLTPMALAGKPVYGVGEDPEIALGKTAEAAWTAASNKKTCISTMPSLERCQHFQDKGNLWQCSAVVANHKGSCGKGNWFADNKPFVDAMIEAGKVAATAQGKP